MASADIQDFVGYPATQVSVDYLDTQDSVEHLVIQDSAG